MLEFEEVKTKDRNDVFGLPDLWRAKVPGGWLIIIMGTESITFYPDPEHEWDGSSIW